MHIYSETIGLYRSNPEFSKPELHFWGHIVNHNCYRMYRYDIVRMRVGRMCFNQNNITCAPDTWCQKSEW